MRQARLLLLALALCAAWGSAVRGDADTDDDAAQPPAIVNTMLRELHLLSTRGAAIPAVLLFGDIDGDGGADAVFTYSHGVGPHGGNQYSQRLALFLNRNGDFILVQHQRIGSKGERWVKLVGIRNGELELEVTFWKPGDPMGGPTGKGTLVLHYDGSGLR